MTKEDYQQEIRDRNNLGIIRKKLSDMIDDLSDISIELEEFNEKEYPESFTDELNEIANRLLPIDKLTECTRNLDEIEDKNQERIMIIKQFLQYIEMPEFLDVAYETFLDEKEFVGDV